MGSYTKIDILPGVRKTYKLSMLIAVSASGGLVLPDIVIKRIEKGETLEEAVDAIFKTQKIGQGIGMFGLMTKGVVTRTSGVTHGVAFVLARFLHAELYG